MKKSFRLNKLPAAVGLALIMLSAGRCSDSTAVRDRVVTGPDVTVGQGVARTEITMNGSTPVAAAVVLSANAFNGLATSAPQGGIEYVLPIPAAAQTLVFTHIGLNWNPNGHPPALVYEHPHFDIHFYLMSLAERNNMTPAADPQFAAKAARLPAGEFAPAGYTADPFGVPRMGVHWGNHSHPERHGQLFTHTMIYGSYDGEIVFMEPMITTAFLQSRTTVTVPIATPVKFATSGDYPTSYTVRFDTDKQEYRIELREFKKFQ